MKESIDFLPEHKQEELKRIVEYVANDESIPVHMIILFGSFARGTWVEDTYQDESGTTYAYKSDYDLFLVTSKEKHATNTAFVRKIRQKIRENCEVETRMTMIFHGISYFNAELAQRNYFFIDIYNEGIMLYDSDLYAITAPPEVLPKDTRLMKARYYYEKWLNSADEFLLGYELYYERKNYPKAVFLLHQTSEHLFMGIHLVYTDYKPKSHDLIDLHNRSIEFNEEFREAFPCRTKEEIDMFKKLNAAYVDARYEKNYVISVSELDYMVERVKVLQKLAEKLCRGFIISFTKEVPNISPELMEKIKSTDASNSDFYEARERAEFIEQKKVKQIEDKKEVELKAEFKIETEKLKEEFAEEAELIKKERTEKIARDLLANGVAVEIVAKSTGLSIEEIEKLKY